MNAEKQGKQRNRVGAGSVGVALGEVIVDVGVSGVGVGAVFAAVVVIVCRGNCEAGQYDVACSDHRDHCR